MNEPDARLATFSLPFRSRSTNRRNARSTASVHPQTLALTLAGATITSRAWLFRANETWTPPVIAHGLLYVVQTKQERGGAHGPRLLCYDLRVE